jgi:hypothetical protein
MLVDESEDAALLVVGKSWPRQPRQSRARFGQRARRTERSLSSRRDPARLDAVSDAPGTSPTVGPAERHELRLSRGDTPAPRGPA